MAGARVQSMLERHRPFSILVSLAFALLYAELGWFAHLAWPARSDAEAALVVGAAFLVTLAAYLGSFLPARSFTASGVEQKASVVLADLTAQAGKGALCVLMGGAVCLALYLYLVAFDLVAATTLLNNLYVFTLAGAGLLHALVAYVRYGALLYDVKQDYYVKVLVVSGGLGLIIAAGFVFCVNLDIAWLGQVPAVQRGLYGLHVYGRDLYFFTLLLAVYGWHARWMADH